VTATYRKPKIKFPYLAN